MGDRVDGPDDLVLGGSIGRADGAAGLGHASFYRVDGVRLDLGRTSHSAHRERISIGGGWYAVYRSDWSARRPGFENGGHMRQNNRGESRSSLTGPAVPSSTSLCA